MASAVNLVRSGPFPCCSEVLCPRMYSGSNDGSSVLNGLQGNASHPLLAGIRGILGDRTKRHNLSVQALQSIKLCCSRTPVAVNGGNYCDHGQGDHEKAKHKRADVAAADRRGGQEMSHNPRDSHGHGSDNRPHDDASHQSRAGQPGLKADQTAVLPVYQSSLGVSWEPTECPSSDPLP